MIINIPTIPHTGSYLVADGLFGGFKRLGLNSKPENGCKYFDHLFLHKIDAWKGKMEAYPSIIPLRHPILTAVSWARRNRDLGEMCVMWYVLVEQLDRYNPYYIPVDSPNRNDWLDRLNKGLRLDLSTNWPIINSKHNTFEATIEDIPEDNREQIERLCKNLDDFLSRFY